MAESEIRELLREIIREEAIDPWLDTPNKAFGGERPRDLIGTDREEEFKRMINRVIHGVF